MPFLVFVFGVVIGSFLNVLIFRLPRNKSILGFSKCQDCRKRIVWHDNIPVLSFLFLKGRCRNCGFRISWQYPLIELLTGFLFLISFFIFPATLSSGAYGENPAFLAYTLFLVSVLTVIAFIDLKHLIIPDSLIFSGFIISFLFIFFVPNSLFLTSRFYGLSFFAGILLFLFLSSKGRWLGLGDVKLAALLGFIFGLEGAVNIFYLTFFFGFIIAIMLLVLKKADLKTQIPLGSMMAGVSILFLLTGFNIFDLINIDSILRLFY